MVESKLTKNCTTCSNVIKLSPEDLIVTCPYCGETYDVDFHKIPEHKMIPTKGKDDIRAEVIDFLKDNKTDTNQISIDEVKANYIPYWVVPYDSSTHYFGVEKSSVTRYRTKTRRVKGSDGKMRTETYRESYSVPVYRSREGDFNRNGKENVIARKNTAFYGFNDFDKTLFLDNIEDFNYDEIHGNEAEFINAEVNTHEAQMDAYGRVENQNRSSASRGLSKLVRCDSNINVHQPLYVHAPLWQARYRYNDKIYKVSIAGDSGKVLKGEIPMTTKRRIINYFVGMIILILFGILGNLGLSIYNNLGEEGVLGIVLTVISTITMFFSFIPLKKAFAMQIEKSPTKEIFKERIKNLKAKKEGSN